MQNDDIDALCEPIRNHIEHLQAVLLGQFPAEEIDEDPSMGLHSRERSHCDDLECPCWHVLPDVAERDFLDVFNQIEDDDPAFSDGAETAYMAFYDTRSPTDRPVLSASGLYQFMKTRHLPEYNERANAGYIAGMLIALGESNPAFHWTSDAPPVRAFEPHTDAMPFCADFAHECHRDIERIKQYYIRPLQDGLLTDREATRLFLGQQV